MKILVKITALIAGPRAQMEGEWWDQANPQPIFVNAFGSLFDHNRGCLHDLTEMKPSLILRLPNRLAFLQDKAVQIPPASLNPVR